MALLEWNPVFSVEIYVIDEQHKKLFGYMNSLYDALTQKREKEILAELFKDLEDYTKTHFSLEEKYFEKFKYPRADAHILQHKYFIKKLEEMKVQIPKGLMDIEDLLDFLVDWLKRHIKLSDHEYMGCFHENGLS
jgi:hemerythrin